jgi:hypothetical protein
MPKTDTPAAQGPSEDKLSGFLVKLATDHRELGHFIRDPDGSMDQAGLSPQDQALLKSGNAAAINGRLRGQPVPQAPPPLLLVDMGPDGKPSVRDVAPHIVGAAYQPAYTTPHIVGHALPPSYVAPHIVGAAMASAAYASPHIVAAALPPTGYVAPHIVGPALQPAYVAPHIVGPAVQPAAYAAPHIVGAALPAGAYAPAQPHLVAPGFQTAYFAPHIVSAAVAPPPQAPYWQQPPPTT